MDFIWQITENVIYVLFKPVQSCHQEKGKNEYLGEINCHLIVRLISFTIEKTMKNKKFMFFMTSLHPFWPQWRKSVKLEFIIFSGFLCFMALLKGKWQNSTVLLLKGV